MSGKHEDEVAPSSYYRMTSFANFP